MFAWHFIIFFPWGVIVVSVYNAKTLANFNLLLLSLFYFILFQGSIDIIEEYRNNTKNQDLECYYLFELNHDAACTVKPKQLSPGSIMLIMWVANKLHKAESTFLTAHIVSNISKLVFLVGQHSLCHLRKEHYFSFS